MKNGDISCNLAPILAFNLDVLTTDELEKGLINKLKKKKKLNLKILTTVNSLWDKYNFRIHIVSLTRDEKDLTDLIGNYQLNYSKFERLSIEELEWKCKNEFTYYYDIDYDIISALNSNSAQHINDLKI